MLRCLRTRKQLSQHNFYGYLRPIALVQAQPKSKTRETHTADKVKETLIQQLNVPAEHIRICIGTNDELGDEDLSSPDCLVEFIVTVDKLREGWDCPFAYVLGSVGNVATETAVEQLLGRVLRMPDAVPTGIPELDRAYAIVQSEDVARTAQSLADSMVKRCGFDQTSIADVLRIHRQQEVQPLLALSSITVSNPPNIAQLPPSVQSKVRYDAAAGKIQIHEPLTRTDAQALRDTLDEPEDRAAVEEYWQEEREVGTVPKMLDQYAPPLRIPQLAVRVGQRWLRFEPIELDEFDWDLNACDPKFSEAEFSAELHVGDKVVIGLREKSGGMRIDPVEKVIARQLSFLPHDDHWEKAELVRWLDRELHRGGQNAGLASSESQAWLNRVVDDFVGPRGIAIPILVRKRHELADKLFHRITDHGRKQIRKAAERLFAVKGERRLETSAEWSFDVEEQRYAPYRRYDGTFDFKRHAFDLIGDMGKDESECAQKINDHPNVNRWIRNLEHESAGGFSLPLSPGKFFPDFLVELNDGRIVIVEYKGPHIAHDPKELHKDDVGKLWAARSDGKCVFVRVVDKDWTKLEQALNKISEQ